MLETRLGAGGWGQVFKATRDGQTRAVKVMHPGQDYETLLAALARKLPGAVLAVGLTQQDPSSFPRPADSPRLQTLDYIETARLPVAGSFDDYWAARGKNLRQNMKKQRAKLQQDGVSTHL